MVTGCQVLPSRLYTLSKFPVCSLWHMGSFVSMLTSLWSHHGFLSFTPCVLPLFIRVTKAAFTEGAWPTSYMSLAESGPCAARPTGRGGKGLLCLVCSMIPLLGRSTLTFSEKITVSLAPAARKPLAAATIWNTGIWAEVDHLNRISKMVVSELVYQIL